MRWKLGLGALTASWGFIAVLAAAVDLGAEPLAFWRLALAAGTLALGAVLVGRPALLAPRGRLPQLALLGAVQGAHWLLFFLAVKHGSVALAVLTFYAAPLVLAVAAPLVLPERWSAPVLGRGDRRRGRHRADRARQRRRVGIRVGRRRGPRVGGHLRRARRALEASPARRHAAPHGRVLGLLRGRARRRAGAPARGQDRPDGAGEWGAVLALGIVLTGVSTLALHDAPAPRLGPGRRGADLPRARRRRPARVGARRPRSPGGGRSREARSCSPRGSSWCFWSPPRHGLRTRRAG